MICAIHNDVPDVVTGDPTRLRQIMANLLGNAVKFTESGQVLIGMRLRPVREPAASGVAVMRDNRRILQKLVQDTGVGMTDAAKQNLFGVFVQADSSTTRKYGGRGTTFSLFVPIEIRTAVRSAAASSLRSLKCLIVDSSARCGPTAAFPAPAASC